MHPLLNIAIQAARSASKIIVRYVDRLESVEVSEKGLNNLVTQVDQLAEEEIINVIHKSYPDHSILAEESGHTAGNEEYCWIIDPLDGTTNFIHGFPQFAVSIAVKYRGEYIVGVIYDPMRQELFTAAKGEGAHLDSRRIRVSSCKKLENALIGTGFPFRDPTYLNTYMNTFTHIFPATSGVRRTGSAALDLAYVAAGRLDGFWEMLLKEWDIAAGALLIKEAGGMLSDFQGKNNYAETGNIVAGNPKIFKALFEKLQESLSIENQ